jgi:hypothetical protein
MVPSEFPTTVSTILGYRTEVFREQHTAFGTKSKPQPILGPQTTEAYCTKTTATRMESRDFRPVLVAFSHDKYDRSSARINSVDLRFTVMMFKL